MAAFSNGKLINYANIGRDCGIDAKTVKEYYQILEDTLLGYHLKPYKNQKKREDLVASSKFYFFDVGVLNGLMKRSISTSLNFEFKVQGFSSSYYLKAAPLPPAP